MHSTRRHLNVLNVLVLLDLLEYCVRNLRKAAHKATERTLMRTLVENLRCVAQGEHKINTKRMLGLHSLCWQMRHEPNAPA